MKNKIFLIAFCVAINLSCNDDSMDRFPLHQIANETFFNSENDLKIYNNNYYNYAKNSTMRLLFGNGTGGGDGQYGRDGMTDNVNRDLSYNQYLARIRAGQITPDDNPASFGWNNNCFAFVRAINIGLANYDRANLIQSVIDKYKAEARLFRAWAVADKVSLYGDYPWIDKELNIDSPELYAERTPRETVMDNVLDDLDFACENLPDNWGDGNAPGRLNRWCALLIKSRICLFEGTWRKYHGGTNPEFWLQEAAAASLELIDNGPYELYSTGHPELDYNAIFHMTDLTGVKEVLWWRRYIPGVAMNSVQWYLHLKYPTKDFVEDYLCTDGLPITLSPIYKGDSIYTNIFENRDPRLRQTILHPDDLAYYDYFNGEIFKVPTVESDKSLRSLTGYHMVKFTNTEQRKLMHTGFYPTIVLRFGEALLNYAEAKAELGNIDQSDLDKSINKLRDRVGMVHMDITNIPVDPRYTDDGVSPLIVEIRRERRVELFSEGFRYDDIRRWKMGMKLQKKDYGMRWDEMTRKAIDPDGNKVNLGYEVFPGTQIEYICPNKGGDLENPVFEAKHYLWPIPVSARSENPALGQNPGW